MIIQNWVKQTEYNESVSYMNVASGKQVIVRTNPFSGNQVQIRYKNGMSEEANYSTYTGAKKAAIRYMKNNKL